MTSERNGQRWTEEVSTSSTDRPSRSRSRKIRRVEEGRSEEEVSCRHLIGDRHHFSVADPIGASTTHDGEYSFGFLSWLARDLGASIDYAKSRLKSGFRPRGSSTFCLVKPEICTSPNSNWLSHAENWTCTSPKNQIRSPSINIRPEKEYVYRRLL